MAAPGSARALMADRWADESASDHADDATWVLTSAFIILTMQSGFGLLEMGSSSPGFEVNIMTKNVMDVVFGALTYWFVGYGLSYGEPSNPFMGMGDFMPDESYSTEESGLLYSRYIFQFSFAATATTIVSGAVAMRMRFSIYCIYSAYAIVVYSFVAHWVWAENGWLRQMGVYDFAGGGPVHLLGGMNALIAVIFVGPRTGYFQKGYNRTKFAASSPASALFGLFMLWWGWIGFNCGSTFGITGMRWIVATRAGMTTINASAAGGAVSLFYTLTKTGGNQVRVHHLVHGILGALVSSSPTCSVIHSWQALIIGAVAAVLACLGNTLMKRCRVDDPVGAVGVHIGGAIWGYVAVGLFADSKLPGVSVMDGLFSGGGGTLLGLQLLAVLSIIGWSLATCVPFFYVLGVILSKDWRDPRSGLRIIKEHELLGEDKRLHGIDLPFDNSINFSSERFTDSIYPDMGDNSQNSNKENEEQVHNLTLENGNDIENSLSADVPVSVSVVAESRRVSCLKDQYDSFNVQQYLLDENDERDSIRDIFHENPSTKSLGTKASSVSLKSPMPKNVSRRRPTKGNSKSSSMATLRSSGTGIMGMRYQLPVEPTLSIPQDTALVENANGQINR